MKKFYAIIFICLLVIMSGCTKIKEGKYIEGTYAGSSTFESRGANYVATAVVYIDDSGMIKSLFIDSTYTSDGVNTTKKVLGDAYGMKSTSANLGVIPGGAEWYEQINTLEAKIIKEQGIDWVTYSDEAKTKLDSVSGVTITANDYIKAVNNALSKAIK